MNKSITDEEETLGPTLSFGNYDLLEPIGERGGMGIVYRAIQLNPRREVAPEAYQDRDRCHRGAYCAVQDRSRIGCQFSIIQTLFAYSNSASMTANSSIRCRSLKVEAFTASCGTSDVSRVAQLRKSSEPSLMRWPTPMSGKIIHRDLKPPNILFDDAQNPMIIDFGCAKRLEADADEGLTADGVPLGTWRYMPPEQAERPGEVDEKADIFSLGAVLYECLVGRPPYQAASVLDTIKHLRDPTFEPPKPREFNPEIDRDLEAICLECVK